MENRGKSKATIGRGRGRNTNLQLREPDMYTPHRQPDMYTPYPPPDMYTPYPPPQNYQFNTQQSSYPSPQFNLYRDHDMNDFDAFHPCGNYRDHEEETDDDDDDEVPETQEEQDEEVEETQPLPSGGRGGGKRGRGNQSGPAPAKMWTPQEEEALAQAYLSISEDGVVGNAQRRNKFWERVLADFSVRLGGTDRTTHQINSKWRDLNTKVSLFSGLYNNNWNNRGSGQSETDVMKVTNEQFKAAKKNKAFTHHGVWDILKGHPRWAPIPLVQCLPRTSSSGPVPKRTKTSDSQTHTTTSSDAHFIPNEELQEPERPQRKGKKPVSNPKDDEFWEDFKNFKQKSALDYDDKIRHRAAVEEIKKEKLRILQETHKLRKQAMDEEFFLKPHEHLTGSAYNMVIQKKKKIAEEYG